MFYNGISSIILIIIILPSLNIQIQAIYLPFNGNPYGFKNRFEDFKQNAEKQDKVYRINRKVFDEQNYGGLQNIFEKQLPKSYKREDSNEFFEEQHDNNSYQNLDLNDEDQSSDYEMFNYIPSKMTSSTGQIHRRELPSSIGYDLQNSSLYPSVLTKALEISLKSNPNLPAGSLFSNVALKMNTTPLDLAEQIANSPISKNDNQEQFSRLVQSFIKNNARPNSNSLSLNPPPLKTVTKKIYPNMEQTSGSDEQNIEKVEQFADITPSNLTAIFDRILNKLDSIENAKSNNDEEQPDGAPCDVIGSWSSTNLGFCFDIQLPRDKVRYISPAEVNNKILMISTSECVPAKRHQIIDLDWKFTGSALRQQGGPFYIYGQKRTESVVATFLGFCRTCGGIDTIFGSWNFLYPSKDCQDISLSLEAKRDILRRVRMEAKRKERFKDLFYHYEGRKI